MLGKGNIIENRKKQAQIKESFRTRTRRLADAVCRITGSTRRGISDGILGTGAVFFGAGGSFAGAGVG